MRSVDDVHRELTTAFKQRNFATALALCREGLALSAEPGMPGWFTFRFTLATMLLRPPDPLKPRDVEEAISLLTELESNQPSSATENEHRKTLLLLGRAFQQRTDGDPRANLLRAILAFTECLRHQSQASDDDLWAKIHLGFLYSELGATVGRADYAEAIHCFNESVRWFKESLAVVSKSEYPEEWEEVQQCSQKLGGGENCLERRGEWVAKPK